MKANPETKVSDPGAEGVEHFTVGPYRVIARGGCQKTAYLIIDPEADTLNDSWLVDVPLEKVQRWSEAQAFLYRSRDCIRSESILPSTEIQKERD